MNQWATFSSYSHFGRQQQSQKEVCASIKCLQKNFTLDNELGCQTRQIIERPEEQCHKQIHHIRKVSAWLGSCIMINGETPLAKMLGRNVWITWQQHLSNILASGVSPLIINTSHAVLCQLLRTFKSKNINNQLRSLQLSYISILAIHKQYDTYACTLYKRQYYYTAIEELF